MTPSPQWWSGLIARAAPGPAPLPLVAENEGLCSQNPKYRTILNIPEAQTLIRGTYRNKGWCHSLQQILDIGMLAIEEDKTLEGMTFMSLTARTLGCEESEAAITAAASKKLGVDASDTVKKMVWMGLLDKATIPVGTPSVLDAVCIKFNERLQYAPRERDMIVMHHILETEWSTGEKETITSTMAAYGEPDGQSAMSRTVCLPLAIAVHMVLSGKFAEPGVSIPTTPKLYEPILAEMASFGVTFTERGSKILGLPISKL